MSTDNEGASRARALGDDDGFRPLMDLVRDAAGELVVIVLVIIGFIGRRTSGRARAV